MRTPKKITPPQPLTRHPANPIITPDQMPVPCSAVFNAGATWFDGHVLLLLRVENLRREVVFHLARSQDGIHFEIEKEPIHLPLSKTEERYGRGLRFDIRVTEIDGTYYLLYASWIGSYGSVLTISTTKDFKTFETLPYLSEPSNRNGVLFPQKINGLYARLDRPQNVDGTGRIWVNYSPDMVFWGQAMPLNLPVTMWAKHKAGAGCIPVKTPQGWLIVYHATAMTASTENYYLGAALLDLNDPSKVIAAPKDFILAAEKDYECMGQVPNVVFTSGGLVMPDGTFNIYYAGADTRMCLAQTTVPKLVDFCLRANDEVEPQIKANFF